MIEHERHRYERHDYNSTLPSDGERLKEFVSEGLSLGNGAETTVGDTLGVELDSSLGETKSLLDDGGQLADTSSLLSKYVSWASGSDDDLSSVGGDTDLHEKLRMEEMGLEITKMFDHSFF